MKTINLGDRIKTSRTILLAGKTAKAVIETEWEVCINPSTKTFISGNLVWVKRISAPTSIFDEREPKWIHVSELN